jgi:hypothetical protein
MTRRDHNVALVGMFFLSIFCASGVTGLSKIKNRGHKLDIRDECLGLSNFFTTYFQNEKKCRDSKPLVTFNPSGGFGDRIRGMVTAFYQALMTDSLFSVDWRTPYELDKFFKQSNCTPLQEETRNSRSYLERSSTNEWSYYSNGDYRNDVQNDIRMSTNAFHWHAIVHDSHYSKRARELDLLNASNACLFKLAIDTIFANPQPVLVNAYQDVLQLFSETSSKRSRNEYVGVQLRLGGGSVVGWSDPPRHLMDDISCFVKEAVSLCHTLQITSIFLTSDSKAAVDEFTKKVQIEWEGFAEPLTVVETSGTIAHTDLSKIAQEGEAETAWLKSVLDWWALKHARALVVSRSSFGVTAAWASGAHYARSLTLNSEKKCAFVDAHTVDY